MQAEAQALAMETFMSIPLRQKMYQPFGDLWIKFTGQGEVINYRQEFDLSIALCRTTYQSESVTYSREYLASFPEQTIDVDIKAYKREAITFDVSLTSLHAIKVFSRFVLKPVQ